MVDERTGITLRRVEVGPSRCAVDARIDLEISFVPRQAVVGGVWSIDWVVDMAHARELIALGKTEPADYRAHEETSMRFSTDGFDVRGVQKCLLNNAAALTASLNSGDGHFIDIVTVIAQIHMEDDKHIRTLLTPVNNKQE